MAKPPHIPKSYTLEEVCAHGIYDEFQKERLKGKPLIDLFPKMRIGKVRTTGDMEILERWGRDYRAKGIPFVVCWLDGDKQHVRLCKEQLADPYEEQKQAGRKTKCKCGLTKKDCAVAKAHSD